MKELAEKDIKRLVKMPYPKASIYYAHKTEGLKKAIKVAYSIMRITTFTWLYRNIKLVKHIVNRRLEKVSPYMRLLFEMCMLSDFDFEKSILKDTKRYDTRKS